MRPGLTISIAAHAVALGLSLVALSAQPMDAPKVDSLPVSFISDKDFDQMTKGVKNAPKPEIKVPKPPLADKIDVPKPVDQTADKVGKQEITTETAAAKQQPKPDPKPPEKSQAKPPPDYKPDQIAQLLKKDADKQPPKPDPKPDAKPAPDKPQKDAPKFNADQVAALLDHREPQRQVATAETVNPNANLGAASGAATELSQSEIAAFQARLKQCFALPPTVPPNPNIFVDLDVAFKADGTVAREPQPVKGSASPLAPILVETAKRALLTCQPFTMLKPEHYADWKRLTLTFNSDPDL